VAVELEIYLEPLEAEELAFLEKKESRERSQYYKVFQVLMVMCFIIPFAGAWYRAYDGAPNAFSPTKFFFTAAMLLSVSGLYTYMSYRLYLRRIQLDIASKTKTIEISHVVRKVYFPVKGAYYFYIDSKFRMSIEVSHDDYVNMKEGDEISIEYTTHSKEYLGYF
jgi:hypothetical protein